MQNGLQNDPSAITPAPNSLHSCGFAADVNYHRPMTGPDQPWTLNRWLGAAALALVTIAGISLIAYGVVAGIRRRRVPKLHRPGEFFVGSEAVAEGVFRAVVGLLLVGFVAWMLRG